MDGRWRDVVSGFEERRRREASVWDALSAAEQDARRDEFLLCVGPEVGEMLHLLARGARATSIVEVGTAYGYSTLWLAAAAREAGGRVISIERSAEKAAHAADALERAGLREVVDLRCGDALEVIPALEGTFDLAVIDLWKDLYVACFDALLPRLQRGALVIADNMTAPASAALPALLYRKHVRRAKGVESVLLPVGAGLFVSRVGVT